MKRQTLALCILVSTLVGSCGTGGQDSAEGSAEAATTPRPRATQTSTVTPEQTAVATAVPPATSLPASIEEEIAKLAPIRTRDGAAGQIHSLAFSPDGQRMAIAASDGTVRLWSTRGETAPAVLDAKGGEVWSIAFSPEGDRLVSASYDGALRIWQVGDGGLLNAIQGLAGHAYRVALSPDGSFLAMGGNLCMVELRHARHGLLARTLTQPACSVSKNGPVVSWGVAFSSDSSLLAVGEGRPCCGGSVQLYSRDEGGYSFSRTLRGVGPAVQDLAFSPDGSLIAISTSGKSIELRKVADGSIAATLAGHLYRVNDLDFSPDGTLLVSASRDGTVKIWRTSDGALLTTLEGNNSPVTAVAFSPDGSLLASATEDGTVILWGAKP